MIDVIPAIDLIDGACVRLTKGDYASTTVYDRNPVAMAKRFADAGISRLHLVDLDGAKAGEPQNLAVLEAIAKATALQIDFGGGLKTIESLESVKNAGAAQVSIGSLAVKNPALMAECFEQFGTDFFILCADAKNGKIATHGWQEVSELAINDFIASYTTQGVRHFLCTNIERDGMLSGTDVALYKDVMAAFPDVYLIASGGISCVQDIAELETARIPAVVVGKAFYEGHISLEQLGAFYVE